MVYFSPNAAISSVHRVIFLFFSKVLIHEIGHILGLWHVHHGSTTEMLCSDECFESFPSLELGDLCSDTKPTVKHTTCADPVVTSETTCGQPPYTDTPYTNYMGYANDSCTNNFTPQQVARMHCYIDLDYQSWQSNPKPSFIPLSPRITEAKKDKIKLSWLPPLGPGGNYAIHQYNHSRIFTSTRLFSLRVLPCIEFTKKFDSTPCYYIQFLTNNQLNYPLPLLYYYLILYSLKRKLICLLSNGI